MIWAPQVEITESACARFGPILHFAYGPNRTDHYFLSFGDISQSQAFLDAISVM